MTSPLCRADDRAGSHRGHRQHRRRTTAVAVGGPGALFWMWITALVGIATKYAELVLAVHYRETDDHGEQVRWPDVYDQERTRQALALARRSLCAVRPDWPVSASATVQSNSIAGAARASFGIDHGSPAW